jgi:hypothetical protein
VNDWKNTFGSASSLHSSKNEIIVKYTVIQSIPIIIIAILYANPNIWRVYDVHHFYFGMFAVAISTMIVYDNASIVAFYA